jgi:outer membrane lipoprotein-sorting protein
MNRRRAVVFVVAVLLLASGCSGVRVFGGGGGQSPPDVDVAAKYDQLETLSATQVSTVRTDNGTNRTRMTVRAGFREPQQQYVAIHGPTERAGDRQLTNGSVSLFYDASENTVTRVPLTDGPTSMDRGQYYARVVAAARDDEQVENPSGGVSPLPVVPATTGEHGPARTIEAYDVTYLGTDTVADRTTHGFRLTASSAAAVDFTRTLWLDAEYYYPLRVNQTVRLENETYHSSLRVENVAFNADLPDGTFELDVPENATVETPNDARTFDSLAALRENVTMSVPDPDVPDGYEFVGARLVDRNGTQVTVQYGDDGALFVSKSATISNETDRFGSGENVTVADHDARYLTTGQANMVTWSCGGNEYSVVGAPLGKEALLAVAESVACE